MFWQLFHFWWRQISDDAGAGDVYVSKPRLKLLNVRPSRPIQRLCKYKRIPISNMKWPSIRDWQLTSQTLVFVRANGGIMGCVWLMCRWSYLNGGKMYNDVKTVWMNCVMHSRTSSGHLMPFGLWRCPVYGVFIFLSPSCNYLYLMLCRFRLAH